MGDDRKSFFKRRTVPEIQDLECEVFTDPILALDRIIGLDLSKQGVILDFPLLHPDFSQIEDSRYASRRAHRGVLRKGGDRKFPTFLTLEQPRSKENALAFYRKGLFPFKIRNKAFFSMKGIPEDKNFYVGYIVWPISGSDMSPTFTTFWSIMEGGMLDAYSGRVCRKLPYFFLNAGSFVERDYSPEIVVRVPSHEKGKEHYVQGWINIPTIGMDASERAVIGWNTKPLYGEINQGHFIQDESKAPRHKLYNRSHVRTSGSGGSFRFTFTYPHCVAGHEQIRREFMRDGDYGPWEMSQFATPAYEDVPVWNAIRNNTLIRYGDDQGKVHFRQPRINESSTLMARYVARRIKMLERKGDIQETMYWDQDRDGKIASYPWLPGGK